MKKRREEHPPIAIRDAGKGACGGMKRKGSRTGARTRKRDLGGTGCSAMVGGVRWAESVDRAPPHPIQGCGGRDKGGLMRNESETRVQAGKRDLAGSGRCTMEGGAGWAESVDRAPPHPILGCGGRGLVGIRRNGGGSGVRA